jgi:hypothetical protein
LTPSVHVEKAPSVRGFFDFQRPPTIGLISSTVYLTAATTSTALALIEMPEAPASFKSEAGFPIRTGRRAEAAVTAHKHLHSRRICSVIHSNNG